MKRGSSFRLTLRPNPPISVATISPSISGGDRLLGCAQFLCGVLDGLDDVDIPRAATEVARNGEANFLLRRIRIAFQQGDAGHHHAGGAEPALETVLLPEPLLDRMELAVLLQILHRAEPPAVCLHREEGARLHRLAIQ